MENSIIKNKNMSLNAFDIFLVSTVKIARNLKDFYAKLDEYCINYSFYETNVPDLKATTNKDLFLVNLFEEVRILKPKVVLIFSEEIHNMVCKKIKLKRDSFNEMFSFYYFEYENVIYFPIKGYNKINN